MHKFKLVLKSLGLTLVLVIIKIVVDILGLDSLETSPVITAIVAGVIFTIAIIFSGVLSDYKEAEKIPGEIAASVKSLYRDVGTADKLNNDLSIEMRSHIKSLVGVIVDNFQHNRWKLSEINAEIDIVDMDINTLYDKGLPPPIVVKMRNELAIIEKLANRVEIIMETQFIPAAYHISIASTVLVLLIVLFTRMDPLYVGILLYGAVSFVLTSLLLLIHDMDNPFEVRKGAVADVDLRIIYKVNNSL